MLNEQKNKRIQKNKGLAICLFRFQRKAVRRILWEVWQWTIKKEAKASFFVIRLGLEPKTPTLKVLCSTC